MKYIIHRIQTSTYTVHRFEVHKISFCKKIMPPAIAVLGSVFPKKDKIWILLFEFFFGQNYSWQYVSTFEIMLVGMCLEHNPFSTFCLIWPNSIIKKNLNFWFWIHLDPKPISIDQIGSGPCPHIQFSEGSWGNFSAMQKMSRRT